MTKALKYLEKGDIHVQGKRKMEEKKVRNALCRVYFYMDDNIWYMDIQIHAIYEFYMLQMTKLNDAESEMVMTAIGG